MMGAQLPLILTTCLVTCGLTLVKSYSQTIDQVVSKNEGEFRENFRNLFDSVAKNNFGESETYRDTLKAEVGRAQYAFDSMRDELRTARNENSFGKRHSDGRSNAKGNVKMAKREAGTCAATNEEAHIGRLDIRVGKILSVVEHPDEPLFYLIKADVGQLKPRTIINALRKFVLAEDMVNRTALIVLNVKQYYYTGIYNEALLLYASEKLEVEVLAPPPTAKVGDLVTVDGYERKPDERIDAKLEVYLAIEKDFKTNEKGEAAYKGVPLNVGGHGPAVVKKLFNTPIHYG